MASFEQLPGNGASVRSSCAVTTRRRSNACCNATVVEMQGEMQSQSVSFRMMLIISITEVRSVHAQPYYKLQHFLTTTKGVNTGVKYEFVPKRILDGNYLTVERNLV